MIRPEEIVRVGSDGESVGAMSVFGSPMGPRKLFSVSTWASNYGLLCSWIAYARPDLRLPPTRDQSLGISGPFS
jgi:hypothetical protein